MTNHGLPSLPLDITCFHMDFKVGGTMYQTIRTMKCLNQLGVNLELVCTTDEGPLRKEVPDYVKITVLQTATNSPWLTKLPKPLKLIACIFQLASHISKTRPHIFISCGNKINLISVLAAFLWTGPTKLILTITNEIYHRVDGERVRALAPFFVKHLYQKADRLLPVSNGLKEDLKDMQAALDKKSITVYPPMDNNKIKSMMNDMVNHPWFNDQDTPVVLAIGRISKQKNFPLLIKALAEANKTQETRLAIIGPGDPDKLLALASELNIAHLVEFLGFQTNPFKYMSRASCFALSSYWEGFGIVIAEALATGLPVVSTDCRHGPREILNDGQYGTLVPVNDHIALSKALIATINNGKNKSSEYCTRAELYSEAAMTRRYGTILMDLMKT